MILICCVISEEPEFTSFETFNESEKKRKIVLLTFEEKLSLPEKSFYAN